MSYDEHVNEMCLRDRHPSDNAWILTHCFKILMMQTGFAVVESSFVRQKNSANIMMKNIADLCFGALAFWATGWALAYGVDANDPDNVNGFAGVGNFFLVDAHDFGSWMFQLSFATTAATIDSGAVAERMNFKPYLLYSTLITGIFYPIVCHWCWDENGWLYKMGYYDFAGSGPVHLFGGVTALTSAWYLGPRHGRFAKNGELEVEVVQGENIGTGHLPGQDDKRSPSNDGSSDGAGKKEAGATAHSPFVLVRQLNHGERILRTRHAESMSHPRWGALMRFKIRPDDAGSEGSERQKGAWLRNLVWGRGKTESFHSRAGQVEISVADEAWRVEDDHQSVGRWVWEVNESELPEALQGEAERGGSVHGQLGHVGERGSGRAKQAKARLGAGAGGGTTLRSMSSSSRGLPTGRETVVFEGAWCAVRRKGLEFREGEGGRLRKFIAFRSVRSVDKWQLGSCGFTMHLTDLSKIEVRVASVGERDAWHKAICSAWRPALSPIKLRFHVCDHTSQRPFGQADLTINSSDKPDPEKFRLNSMLRLSCGGRLEVCATFTSAERLSREIFQSWDPVKLLFGTFVLWINWFSFNAGSTYGVMDGGVELAAKVAVASILAASAGAVSAVLLSEFRTGAIEVESLSLGVLGSLVSVTASSSVIQPWEAAMVGFVGGLLSNSSTILLARLGIDDPCAASAVHGASGLWGVIAVGLLARPEPCTGIQQRGLFAGGGFELLGVQLLGCAAIAAWSAFTCLAVCYPLDYLSRRVRLLRWMRLRPSKATEMVGFDQAEHNIHRADSAVISSHEEDESVQSLARKRWSKAQVAVRTAISLKRLGLPGASQPRAIPTPPTSQPEAGILAAEPGGLPSAGVDESHAAAVTQSMEVNVVNVNAAKS